jgi:hypothetical protein
VEASQLLLGLLLLWCSLLLEDCWCTGELLVGLQC